MMVIAMDLGVRCGIAAGLVGQIPRSHTKILKGADSPRESAFAALIGLLDETFRAAPPDLLVKEAPLSAAAFRTLGNADATVRFSMGLHACVEAMCSRYRVKWTEVAPATVRKHFLGKANAGSRAQTKAAVIARCHSLGFLDRACKDEDRADAISIFDWAASQSRTPAALHLFGEVPDPFVSIGDAAAAVVRKVRRRRAA